MGREKAKKDFDKFREDLRKRKKRKARNRVQGRFLKDAKFRRKYVKAQLARYKDKKTKAPEDLEHNE